MTDSMPESTHYLTDKERETLRHNAQLALDSTSPSVSDGEGYISIDFQFGPVRENGVNGTTIERVIDILVNRLKGFQKGPFSCRENALAITHLEQARMWLEERTRLREQAGVEGTNHPHS